jgi:hypothetical protein
MSTLASGHRNGPPLVASAWWVSHTELDWADTAFRGLWESVSDGHTLVRYDRFGVGMSDRDVCQEDLTLDGDVALLRAGARRAGVGEGRAGRRLVGRLRGNRLRGPPPQAGRPAIALRRVRRRPRGH